MGATGEGGGLAASMKPLSETKCLSVTKGCGVDLVVYGSDATGPVDLVVEGFERIRCIGPTGEGGCAASIKPLSDRIEKAGDTSI
jgi:hypothetical protein